MPEIDQNEVKNCLQKCRNRENELLEELNAIRSQIKALNQIQIEIFPYEKDGKLIEQENKKIDELTGQAISDERMQEIYDKIIPTVQAM